jgi:hypothetical protein
MQNGQIDAAWLSRMRADRLDEATASPGAGSLHRLTGFRARRQQPEQAAAAAIAWASQMPESARLIDLRPFPTYKPPEALSRQGLPHPSRGADGRQEKVLETHLPTIAARPQAASRFPRAHGDESRPEGDRAAQSQGAQAPVCLAREPRLPGDGHRTSQDPA